MEQKTKRIKYDDARTLLRRCFRNSLFSSVPFDIWKDILDKTTVETTNTVVAITLTCRGFQDLVRFLQVNNLVLAKRYRRDGWIAQAKKCLENCVEQGNLDAKYCMADAYRFGGWGFEIDEYKGLCMFEELQTTGLFVVSWIVSEQPTGRPDISMIKDTFQIGEYYYYGSERGCAIPYYTIAANEGNEFAQYKLGIFYLDQQNLTLAIHWLYKSAAAGYVRAQTELYWLLYGNDIYHDYALLTAAAKQKHNDARKHLTNLHNNPAMMKWFIKKNKKIKKTLYLQYRSNSRRFLVFYILHVVQYRVFVKSHRLF